MAPPSHCRCGATLPPYPGAGRPIRTCDACAPATVRQRRRWNAANVEKCRASRRAFHQRNPGYNLARRYGVTASEREAMLAAQGGHCATCSRTKPEGRGGWHLDHDHRFKLNDRRGHRGLLCNPCNLMLGHAGDDPVVLERGAAHLRAHRARLQSEGTGSVPTVATDAQSATKEKNR